MSSTELGLVGLHILSSQCALCGSVQEYSLHDKHVLFLNPVLTTHQCSHQVVRWVYCLEQSLQ